MAGACDQINRDRVGGGGVGDAVGMRSPIEDIMADATIQGVVGGSAIQEVVAAATEQRVAAGVTVEAVRLDIPVQEVGIGRAGHVLHVVEQIAFGVSAESRRPVQRDRDRVGRG